MLDRLYDMPLFRPPSEGNNLIWQVTIGCSFNRCSFCSMYRSKAFRARSLAEAEADLSTLARIWPEAQRIFLADGDAFSLPTDHLLALCTTARRQLPGVTRISAYATPANLLQKTPEELAALRQAGLSLVYVGIESGDALTLRRITKGASPDGIVAAVIKAREAGIKVSATVILGLAGENDWERHIRGTAEVLNACAPTYVSTLQLHLEEERIDDFIARFQRVDRGVFLPRSDQGMLEELEMLIDALQPQRPIIFRSNHVSNALPLAGTLPKDRQRLLADIGAVRNAWGPHHDFTAKRKRGLL